MTDLVGGSIIAVGGIWLADKIASHAVAKILDEISAESQRTSFKNGIVSTISIKFRTIQDFRRSSVLKTQLKYRSFLFNFYAGESKPLRSGGKIRIPYSHQVSLFEGTEESVSADDITSSIGSEYILNDKLEIRDFKKCAKNYAIKILKIKEPHPGATVRVNHFIGAHFEIAKADYIDQFSSSIKEIVDLPLIKIIKYGDLKYLPKLNINRSLRELDSVDGKLVPFSDSKLSNTIGIAATVITIDGYLILPRRNKSVHFTPNMEGCSVSGALKWSTSFGMNNTILKECVQQLLGNEAAEELFLTSDSCEIKQLSFAREYERVGKPQFFFHIWTNKRREEIDRHWRENQKSQYEYLHLSWIKLSNAVSEVGWESATTQILYRIAALLSTETAMVIDGRTVVLSEEVRACLYYLGTFLEVMKSQAFPELWLG